MQPYQNYWMNNYQQPMYQNQQAPYIEQFNQFRPVQQMPVQQLSGRFVDAFESITANDVPMDGNGAIFVKRDGSEIQVRNWTAQGTIATSVFKPVQMANPKEISGTGSTSEIRLSDDVVAMLQEQFEKINKRFDELEKSILPLD